MRFPDFRSKRWLSSHHDSWCAWVSGPHSTRLERMDRISHAVTNLTHHLISVGGSSERQCDRPGWCLRRRASFVASHRPARANRGSVRWIWWTTSWHPGQTGTESISHSGPEVLVRPVVEVHSRQARRIADIALLRELAAPVALTHGAPGSRGDVCAVALPRHRRSPWQSHEERLPRRLRCFLRIEQDAGLGYPRSKKWVVAVTVLLPVALDGRIVLKLVRQGEQPVSA